MIFHPSLKTISKYLDGLLDEKKKEALDDHLKDCDVCRKKVEFLNKTTEVFQFPDEELRQVSDLIMDKIEKKHAGAAGEYIGRIVSVTGSVFVNNRQKDELQSAFPGISVYRGDTIITADEGKALLALDDGSCIYINKSTELDFSDIKYSAVLDRGEFFAMMKPQKTTFTVNTPAALLNVVGTDFDTVVTDSRETILKVLKGEVEFCTGSHSIPVRRRRQVSTIINQAPVKEKIRNTKSVKGWTNGMDSRNNGGDKGGMFKKILAGLITVIIALGIYYALKSPQTRSVDSRQPADMSFEELYRLNEGEYLRVISPPFIPEREEYYRKEVPYQEGDVATSIYFKWENDQLHMTNRMHGGSPTIESYIYSTTSLQPFRIAGDQDILAKIIEGDFIYRPSVNYEENLEALGELEEIISKAVNRNIRLEFRDAPIKVVVMGDNLKKEYTKGKKLEINIPAKGRQGGSYGGSVTLDYMAKVLGMITGKGVVFDAQARPDTIIVFKIDYHHDDIKKDSQWLFDEFAAQTGLAFNEEERTFSVLFVEAADQQANVQ